MPPTLSFKKFGVFMRIQKNVLTVILILVFIAGILLFKSVLFRGDGSEGGLSGRRVKGPLNAPVKIVVYTDFQCPACSKANQAVEGLLEKYKGKVSLEHRHYPLKMHVNALKASIFAECASIQGKFWSMHDVLFKSQTSWEKMPDPVPYLTDLSVGLGLDRKALDQCVADGESEKRVLADKENGDKLGVQATPTFIIDGKFSIGAKNLQLELERRLGN